MVAVNKEPVSYKQTDPRWAKLPYQVSGETATIGGSGCGPTCAAMLIRTLTGQDVSPADTCAWAMLHGYKALNQGTYYSYFVPQFREYGISCARINTSNVYGHPDSCAHDEALQLLQEGYYIIACMGKGLWTSSGHFVVVWWADGRIYIHDPASSKAERLRGDPAVFRRQVKYYWAIDARAHNREESEDMAPRYNTVAEIHDAASWADTTIRKMIKKGYISGGGKKDANGDPADMNLSMDMIRMLVMLNAAGAFDK